LRSGNAEPCTGTQQSDLMRAFRRQDDRRGELQDVRAALPGSAIAIVRVFGMSGREGTVLVQDVQVAHHGTGNSLVTLSTQPRSLKGRPVRGAPTSTLCCQGVGTSNPLALQERYFAQLAADPCQQYWAFGGEKLTPRRLSKAMENLLPRLGIHPPPFCFYSSHSLGSGSATAMVCLGVPMPVIVHRGGWGSDSMVLNVYFDGRISKDSEMERYFWSLLPATRLPPPQ